MTPPLVWIFWVSLENANSALQNDFRGFTVCSDLRTGDTDARREQNRQLLGNKKCGVARIGSALTAYADRCSRCNTDDSDRTIWANRSFG